MIERPSPFGNFFQLKLELPWELAEQLRPYLVEWLSALNGTLDARAVEDAARAERRAATDRECEASLASWRALAQACEAEIKHRANHPGSRQTIIRQLAAEQNLSVSFLNTILRVYRRDARVEHKRSRIAEALRLRFARKANAEIAKELGCSVSMVEKYLAEGLGSAPRARRRASTQEPAS